MTRFAILAMLAGVLGSGTVAQVGTDPIATAQSEGYATGVGISRQGTAPEFAVSGPIHKNGEDEVSANAAWHIGSITKSFTATLVLQQVDRGVLTLDAPIGIYLPEDVHDMDPSWENLTLRQLLSHTAGVPANAGLVAMRMRGAENLHATRKDVLAGLWGNPVTPGGYTYSNIGYVLAGYVLETVTNTTWEDLIRNEIAAPLALSSLGFGAPSGPATPWGHRNWLLIKRPVAPTATGADNPPWLGPAGTLHMSLADLITWGQAHLAACRGERPALLSAKSCQDMQLPNAENYGLGWVIRDSGRVWHNGSNTMWYALLSIDPRNDTVIVAATNVLDADRIDTLVRSLVQAQ